jgi:hypothetical protein
MTPLSITTASHSHASSQSLHCSSSLSSKTELSKKVRFRKLEIIEFPIVLGNSPAVSQGAPIGLGSEELSCRTVDIYQYDILVGDERRSRDDLKLSVSDRAGMLLRAGYTIDEIVEAVELAEHDRKLREESLQNQKWDRVNELMLRTGRKVKRVLSVTAKSA